MKRIGSMLMSLAVAVLVAANVATAAPPDKKGPPKEKPVPGVFRLPKHIEPTADQQAKLDALLAKYLPKVRALDEQADAVFTADQKTARDAARKAAHDAGLKGKEANERVDAAVKLTPEQTAKRTAAKEAKHQLDEEIRVQVTALLTAEQKQTLDKPEKKGPPDGKPHPKKPGPPHGEKGPKPKAK